MLARLGIRRSDVIVACRMAVATLATFAVLAPIAHVAGQSDGFVVLGVIVCLTSTRSALRRERHAGWRLAARAAVLPLVVAAIALVGTLFVDEPVFADALFVAAAFAALWTRRFPPIVSEIVRLVQLPLIALFIAPVPPTDRGIHGLPWLLVASVVALTFGTLVQIPGNPPAPSAAAEPPTTPPPSSPRRRIAPTTKLALQSAVGLTMAFAIGQNCFSPRWTWTVVSAFTVGAGSRSRGDVILRGGERLVGALAGTVAATAAIAVVGHHRDLAVAAILCFIVVGLLLRERTYVAWAFCVTGALALLYGLAGESASNLLGERLAEVTVGAACAIAASVVIYPIPTEAVTRKAMAEMLAATDALLAGASDPTAEGASHRHAVVDARLERLRAVSGPARVAHRLGLPGGHVATWVRVAERHVADAKALVAADSARGASAIGHARRTIGAFRRTLREPLAKGATIPDEPRGTPPAP